MNPRPRIVSLLLSLLIFLFILALGFFLAGCGVTIYKNGDQLLVDAGTDRKLVTPNHRTGQGTLAAMTGIGNAAGTVSTYTKREAAGGRGQPTIEIIGADGSEFRTWGTQDQTTMAAETWGGVGKVVLIDNVRRVWNNLIDETFSWFAAESADDIKKAGIDAAAKVERARLEAAAEAARRGAP